MSESDPPADDADILAGEYVLGGLDAVAIAQCAARRRADPDFDRLVLAWEARLAPAASLVADVPPPRGLRQRIEAELGAGAESLVRRLRRELWVWRGLSAASVALACAVLASVWLRPAAPAQEVTALLAPGSGGFVVRVTGGGMRLDPVRPEAVPAGRDLELWSLPAGATVPRPLGVLPATGLTLPPGTVPLGEGQLLVSLEPEGGSPSGAPTGPVVLSGALKMPGR